MQRSYRLRSVYESAPPFLFARVAAVRAAMQIRWMTRDELAQAVPPPFSRHVGLAAIEAQRLAVS